MNLLEAEQFINDELPAKTFDEGLKQAGGFERRQSLKESFDAVEVFQRLQVEVVAKSAQRTELKRKTAKPVTKWQW